MWKSFSEHWERLVFALVGFACLIFSFKFLYEEKIPYASACFAIAFFSFLYSNLARFKRFKGLGFEAELWEDKQEEASVLIERLKNVVSIYTREILINNVLRGRIGEGDWKYNWELFDDLVSHHDALGQDIDFTDLKKKMDGIFLFDMCQPLRNSIKQTIQENKSDIVRSIRRKYGEPIRDIDSYNREMKSINEINFPFDDMFDRSLDENIAYELKRISLEIRGVFESVFSTIIEFDTDAMKKLDYVATLHEQRPLKVNQKMIELANAAFK